MDGGGAVVEGPVDEDLSVGVFLPLDFGLFRGCTMLFSD